MGRPKLSNQKVALRAAGKRRHRAFLLCKRLDKYVALAEALKPGSKGRAAWLAKADAVRAELQAVDH